VGARLRGRSLRAPNEKSHRSGFYGNIETPAWFLGIAGG
jgi:hypothetical protein